MAVSSTTSSTSATAAASTQLAATGTTQSASATKDQFMKMLLAQLKNQDPTNPMDNAQMTSQLAQISTVQGIEELNSTMSKFADSFGKSRATDSVGLIGQSVLAAGSAVTLTSDANATVRAGVSLSAAADTMKVELLDKAGNVVDAQEFGARDAGTTTFEWDGKDPQGNKLSAGSYTMRVTASASGKAVEATALTASQVMGVTEAGTAGTKVLLAGGTSIGTDDIKGVFRP